MDRKCEIFNNIEKYRAKGYVIGWKSFLFHDTADDRTARVIVLNFIETVKVSSQNIY